MQKIISIKDGVTRMPEWRMAEPVNFESCEGEHIAIVGPNGGGKSMFVDIIVNARPGLLFLAQHQDNGERQHQVYHLP